MPARTKPLTRKPAAKKAAVTKRPPSARAPKAATPAARLAAVIDLLEAALGVPQYDGPRDGLEVIVLTILSQNTTDVNALRGYTKLCETYPRAGVAKALRDPAAIPRKADGEVDPVAIRLSQVAEAFFSPDWQRVLDAPEAELINVIRPAGLPNTKAPAIQRVLKWLHKKTGGWKLEAAIAGLLAAEAVTELSSIKGVGVKTAAVTLIEATGADLCPVDTHVHRIIHRLKLVPDTTDPAKTYQHLGALLADPLLAGRGFSLHHNLLTHGRTVCTAKSPKCGECFLRELCPSRNRA
jgi:endonuclease-3